MTYFPTPPNPDDEYTVSGVSGGVNMFAVVKRYTPGIVTIDITATNNSGVDADSPTIGISSEWTLTATSEYTAVGADVWGVSGASPGIYAFVSGVIPNATTRSARLVVGVVE